MSIAATKQIMMSDMFVNNTSVGNRHLKTTTQDFKEIEISRGYFFTGTTNFYFKELDVNQFPQEQDI